MQPGPRDLIVWDIIEEHADEASFLGAQWERALDSPVVDLGGLADGVERRLCAHLDALLVAGPRVADKLLLPAIADDEPELAFVAALALLASPAPTHADAVVRRWSLASGRERVPLTRALCLAPGAPHRADLHAALTRDDPSLRAAAIDVLGFHRTLRPTDIDPLRGDPDPTVRHALVRAAGDPALGLASLVRESLHTTDAGHLAAALTSAAILGLPELPAACRLALDRDDAAGARALLLTALTLDDPATLLSAIDRPPALFALGFTGNFAAAEACVRCIRDDNHPALAFEAFTALTGTALPHRPPPDDDALPELADDDLTADIASGPEHELPLPDPDVVLAWWHAHADRLPRPRLHADDRPTLLAALHHAPMRRRHALALRLAIRTGHPQLETRAPARRQLAALRRLATA